VNGLDPDQYEDFEGVIFALKQQYFKSPNLLWKQAADLWNEAQKPS
jgi:hypothetical protein